MLEDDDDILEADEDEDEDDDQPATVYVGMGPGGKAADDAYRVISGACDRLSLEMIRARPEQVLGSPSGEEALENLFQECDFAIIDLTHPRPTSAREIALADEGFHPDFILLIAQAGAAGKKFPEIEGRTIHSYADMGDLRMIIERNLNTMIDAWNEGDEDEDEDDDDDDV